MKTNKLNFSILTAGNIAQTMAGTVSKMNEVNCRAIAARNLERAKDMADKFGFETSFGSYEESVNDKDTDIIYVASPHSHHFEHAKMCLEHGKHVLCEKSFTVNYNQAKELFDIAKDKNLFIMEAVWTRFQPGIKKVIEIMNSGIIGKPSFLNVSFCFPLLHVARMVKPELAGGALLDLGIYPITLASMLFGTDIRNITSYAQMTEAGVDLQNSITIEYKSGTVAVLHSNMGCCGSNSAQIGCSEGYIEADNFWCCEKFRVYKKGSSEPLQYDIPFDISGYEYEVRAMISAINSNKTECAEMPHSETLRVLKLMDDLRASWGLSYPFE